MTDKSIEIYYDISEIPDITDRSGFSAEALGFRNAAMEHIENALTAANLGKWAGAEIGSGEVNFGFDVEDFDQAEVEIRRAVKDTRFANIREIERREFSEEDYEEMDNAHDISNQKPFGFLDLLSLLVFKRMPKRFLKSATDDSDKN